MCWQLPLTVTTLDCQTCGGTLLCAWLHGLRTAILDLTRGEAGTRGTSEDRAREANEAGKLLGVSWREALDLPDCAIENTLENRKKIARVVREVRPRVVILPYWQARHPDHAVVPLRWDTRPILSLELAVGKLAGRRIGLSRLCTQACMRMCGQASLWISRHLSSSGIER